MIRSVSNWGESQGFSRNGLSDIEKQFPAVLNFKTNELNKDSDSKNTYLNSDIWTDFKNE